MERINDILYRMHKTSYYFMMGAFTSYGASDLALGICLCIIFVTGAYTESLLLVIMGIFGPFVEARAIVEVYDEGRKHMAGMWGGSGLLPDSDPFAYQASLDRFTKLCRDQHVDVELCAHPTLDNGLERHALVRTIVNGVPNPFVIGEAGFAYYMGQYYDLVEQAMRKRGLK